MASLPLLLADWHRVALAPPDALPNLLKMRMVAVQQRPLRRMFLLALCAATCHPGHCPWQTEGGQPACEPATAMGSRQGFSPQPQTRASILVQDCRVLPISVLSTSQAMQSLAVARLLKNASSVLKHNSSQGSSLLIVSGSFLTTLTSGTEAERDDQGRRSSTPVATGTCRNNVKSASAKPVSCCTPSIHNVLGVGDGGACNRSHDELRFWRCLNLN